MGVHGYRPRKGQFRGWIEALKRYRLFPYGEKKKKKKEKKIGKIPVFRYPFCRNCVGGKSRVDFMRNFTLEFGVFLSLSVYACRLLDFQRGKTKKKERKKNEKSVVFAIRWTENIYNFRNFRRAGNISNDTSVFFPFFSNRSFLSSIPLFLSFFLSFFFSLSFFLFHFISMHTEKTQKRIHRSTMRLRNVKSTVAGGSCRHCRCNQSLAPRVFDTTICVDDLPI